MLDYTLKRRLAAGEVLIGMGVLSHNPVLIEILGHTGFDFAMIDTEHSPLGVDIELAHLVRAAHAAGLPVIVRVKGAVDHMIQNALELGAEGILVPHLQSRAQAEAAIRAAKFPPAGERGFASTVRAGRFGGVAGEPVAYMERVNRDTMVIGLAEDRGFFDRLDDILAVKGLDLIYFGAADLAVSMGLSPRDAQAHPAVIDARRRLVEAAARHGVRLMARAGGGADDVRRLSAEGFQVVLAGSDIAHFRALCAGLVGAVRAAPAGP